MSVASLATPKDRLVRGIYCTSALVGCVDLFIHAIDTYRSLPAKLNSGSDLLSLYNFLTESAFVWLIPSLVLRSIQVARGKVNLYPVRSRFWTLVQLSSTFYLILSLIPATVIVLCVAVEPGAAIEVGLLYVNWQAHFAGLVLFELVRILASGPVGNSRDSEHSAA